jgi:hypothetical protein
MFPATLRQYLAIRVYEKTELYIHLDVLVCGNPACQSPVICGRQGIVRHEKRAIVRREDMRLVREPSHCVERAIAGAR